jgi:hypothetical protein
LSFSFCTDDLAERLLTGWLTSAGAAWPCPCRLPRPAWPCPCPLPRSSASATFWVGRSSVGDGRWVGRRSVGRVWIWVWELVTREKGI